MAGRAGRSLDGEKTLGESYVICKNSEKEKVSQLVVKTIPDIESCMAEDKRGLSRALLEAIACGLVKSVYDVER
jgi:DNA polymerase theta